jgi:hypothetical protein
MAGTMKELISLIAIMLVLSGCVSDERTSSDNCAGGACQTGAGLINGSRETSDVNASSEAPPVADRTPMEAESTATTWNANANLFGANSDHLEIIHFHGDRQCDSCRAVGSYAEETVVTYFSDELKSGKIVFGHINYDLPENKALAKKYAVTGSSLWIGTYKGGVFRAEENVNVWYKIGNKEDYTAYFKSVIEEKLKGL